MFLVIESVAGPFLKSGLPLTGGGELASDVWPQSMSLVIGTALTLKWVGGEPWSVVWLDREAARPSTILVGLATGAAAIAIPTTILIGAHWLRLVPGDADSWWRGASRVTLALAPAALTEELLARGYVLSVLARSWGWPWAIGATSIAFGALHMSNPGATPQSIALVTLAGIFLGAVLYGTRSLFAAWAAHLAWNWTMAVAFHVAVSGLPLEAPGYRYVDAGPDWATGGSWGPEAGLPAGFTMIAGSAWLFSRRGRQRRSTGET